jgi:tRNA(Ile)-lysidine synthase
MTKQPTFEDQLARAWPCDQWSNVTVLVACSGGGDSVGLLCGLARLKAGGTGRLWVGHFNHGLRRAESDADERFVAQLADRLGMGCRIGRSAYGELATAEGGLHAAGRIARYRFLQSTAEELGARYVVTAHTADDQVETILHRLLRGTGLAGLAGMQRARPLGRASTLLRPLLGVRRAEIRSYLMSTGQPWREDASNAATDATRNWLRHELLPRVEQNVNPAAAEAIERLGRLAGEAQAVVERCATELAARAIAICEVDRLECLCDLLAGQNRYVVRELFVGAWRSRGWPEQSMGFDEWDALAGLALAPPQAATYQRDFPGAIRAQKKGARLTLARL